MKITYNSLSHEEFVNKIKGKFPHIKILTKYDGCHKLITYSCYICQMEGLKGIYNCLSGGLLSSKYGCPECSKKQKANTRLKNTEKKFRNIMKELYSTIEVVGEYIGASKYIQCKCKVCGFDSRKDPWNPTPYSLKNGVGCPKCVGQIKGNTESFKEEMKTINPDIEIIGEYKTTNTYIDCLCKKCGFDSRKDPWKPKPVKLKSGRGCPNCNRAKSFVGINEDKYFKPVVYDIFSEYEVIPQYPLSNGKYNLYVVDFYIPELKLVIEYDEDHHQRIKDKDKKRQTYIENVLGCDFIRINDREFMKDNNYVCEILNDYFTKAHM
jgi:very-short-patch-repair endonuclease